MSDQAKGWIAVGLIVFLALVLIANLRTPGQRRPQGGSTDSGTVIPDSAQPRMATEVRRDSLVRAAAIAAALKEDRALTRKCGQLIRVCIRNGVCGEFDSPHPALAVVRVGGPWYSLTFDQKEMLARAIAHNAHLAAGGSVVFDDLYTGKPVAVWGSGGLSIL